MLDLMQNLFKVYIRQLGFSQFRLDAFNRYMYRYNYSVVYLGFGLLDIDHVSIAIKSDMF